MNKLLLVGIFTVSGLFAACTPTNQPVANTTKPTNTTLTNTATAPKKEDETPAAIKAIFPDAESITKQTKDLTKEQLAEFEEESGAKTTAVNHLSYLAMKTEGGTRKQLGAATLVKADGKEMIVIYENKDGSPTIKEIKADGVAAEFLKQFNGKEHDEKMQIGKDLKTNGVDEKTAKAIAEAVRIDSVTMQVLYGKAHKH